MSLVLNLILILFFASSALADVDHQSAEISGEYGLSYQSVSGLEKKNNTKGHLASAESPYFKISGAARVLKNLGVQLYGGTTFTQFLKSPKFQLGNRNLALFLFGAEAFYRSGDYLRIGFFVEQKERPLYYATTPTEVQMYKNKFIQPGVHFSLSQRRRVGLLWNVGAKGFTMTPKSGGQIATESGVGGEAYAKLGFVDFTGTQYSIKGFYQTATSPNAIVKFTNEELGYSLQITRTF